ncbi:MAG: murein L,D-transpeptidase [Rhodomicrobium sp.]|nr:murein L,D-transpeptidase [Rhodomicrobium sp.]
MIRFLLRAALIAVLCGIGAFLFFRESVQRAADSAWMATRHLNRKLHYQLGYQLPGTPDLARMDDRLAERSLKRGDPIFIRIFKSELTLELWMKRGERFELFASYPICYWSGRLGPKLQTGDRQAPEGFYTVSRGQLNPNSRWHRSFNLGFPNLFDQAHGRTGSFLMVHGGCSSIGCYAMTNDVISEIWDLVTAALDNGQERFAVHVFPFRLTDMRLAAYETERWADFWRELKPGYEAFEATQLPPEVTVCQGRYVVKPAAAGSASAAPLRNDCTASPAAADNRMPSEGASLTTASRPADRDGLNPPFSVSLCVTRQKFETGIRRAATCQPPDRKPPSCASSKRRSSGCPAG